MKTRGSMWFDTVTHKPVYGIQVHHGGQWINAMDNSGSLLFDTEEDRDAKRKELNSRDIPTPDTKPTPHSGKE